MGPRVSRRGERDNSMSHQATDAEATLPSDSCPFNLLSPSRVVHRPSMYHVTAGGGKEGGIDSSHGRAWRVALCGGMGGRGRDDGSRARERWSGKEGRPGGSTHSDGSGGACRLAAAAAMPRPRHVARPVGSTRRQPWLQHLPLPPRLAATALDNEGATASAARAASVASVPGSAVPILVAAAAIAVALCRPS